MGIVAFYYQFQNTIVISLAYFDIKHNKKYTLLSDKLLDFYFYVDAITDKLTVPI